MTNTTELTEKQREALLMALNGGYYSIPRVMNTDDLANELGISSQAVSERLRRATKKMAQTSFSDLNVCDRCGDYVTGELESVGSAGDVCAECAVVFDHNAEQELG